MRCHTINRKLRWRCSDGHLSQRIWLRAKLICMRGMGPEGKLMRRIQSHSLRFRSLHRLVIDAGVYEILIPVGMFCSIRSPNPLSTWQSFSKLPRHYSTDVGLLRGNPTEVGSSKPTPKKCLIRVYMISEKTFPFTRIIKDRRRKITSLMVAGCLQRRKSTSIQIDSPDRKHDLKKTHRSQCSNIHRRLLSCS